MDLTGQYIVGTDGKPVTYKQDSKGNVTWSKNAGADVQRIGNSMLQTNAGTESLNRMRDAEHSISLNIDKSVQNHDMLGVCYNIYDNKEDPNRTVEASKIVIFENNIENSNLIKRDVYSEFTIDDFIGAVAGHEEQHSTNKNSILMSWFHDKTNNPIFYELKEADSKRIEKQILWQRVFGISDFKGIAVDGINGQ
jgi:hypothetical protein